MTSRIDLSVLKDSAWLGWLAMIPLLAARLAGAGSWAIWTAAGVCLALMLCDLVKRRGEMRAMSVQIRAGYVLLLALGLLPGMSWLHWMQLAGTSVRVLTGYCLLQRELLMLPWNASGPMTPAEMRRILLTPPGDGGILRLGQAAHGMSTQCALGK